MSRGDGRRGAQTPGSRSMTKTVPVQSFKICAQRLPLTSDLHREGRVEGEARGRGGEAGTGRGTRSRCAQRFWFRSDAASKRLYACEQKRRRTANKKGGSQCAPGDPPETPAGRGATAPSAPCAPAAAARRCGESEMRVHFVRGGGRCASTLYEVGGAARPSCTVRGAGDGAPPACS